MASRKLFWHVPEVAWHDGIVAGGTGNQNTGSDIVLGLVSTSPASNLAVPDNVDDWVVKRIVGQYLIQGNESVANNYIMHHRVYPVDSNAVSISLRDLATADDAESDFLWHKVEPWPSGYNNDLWGNWQLAGNGLPSSPFRAGRHGDIDITVNRRIGDGQDLIWHTQFEAPAAPTDNTFDMFCWLRILLQEAG